MGRTLPAHYPGPLIIARPHTPVRLLVDNLLPTGANPSSVPPQPGNFASNLFIGSFNSRLPPECFKALWFFAWSAPEKRGKATEEKNPLREDIL